MYRSNKLCLKSLEGITLSYRYILYFLRIIIKIPLTYKVNIQINTLICVHLPETLQFPFRHKSHVCVNYIFTKLSSSSAS